MSTTEKLASEFPPTTHDEWKVAAEKLLKGAPFDKIMLTPTPESITLQPIYEKDTLAGLPAAATLPGQDGYLRGTRPEGYRLAPWDIAQELPYSDPATFNAALLHDLDAGQNAVSIPLTGDNALKLATLDDLRTALKGVIPDAISYHFQSGTRAPAIAAFFYNWLKEQKADTTQIRGTLNYDPLGVLATDGELTIPLARAYDEMADLVKFTSTQLPGVTAVGFASRAYHNAGASAVEELGALLATGVAYLRALGERGVDIDIAAPQIAFHFSLGGNFFMELAKLRAARVLWSRIVAAFGGSPAAQAMRQHAHTGLYNKTKHDPYVNILRTTTEALSGVLGGVDSLTVGTFDECVRLPEEFSRRVARNTQIILQEECELTAVIDPAGGSWYIEKLTDDLARKAWAFFQEIEKQGGAAAALKAGFIQDHIATTRKDREKLLGQRRVSLVGTNQYPNIQEKPLPASSLKNDTAEKRTCSGGVKVGPVSTFVDLLEAATTGATRCALLRAYRAGTTGTETVSALPNTRLARRYEELRAAAQAYKAGHGHGPKIHLANINVLRRHKARADFTRAFFETGGFEITGAEGSTDVQKIAADAVQSGAQLVVICGHDEDYVTYVADICKAIKATAPQITLILAGNPGDNEAAFKAAGLDTYIFVKSDNYETNKQFLTKVGAL